MSSASIIWGVFFCALGAGYVVYGRKQRAAIPFCCGLALVVTPYFIDNVWILVLLGVGLAIAPFATNR